MKTIAQIVTISAALLLGILGASAADRKIEAGPKGGRLLEKTDPRAEFLVGKDHTVSIHFYDAALKPVAAGVQGVTVIADVKGGKTKLEFEKQGDALVSKGKLPEGDGYNVVVQFQANPVARSQNFRFTLDLHNCGGCKRAEYACTCGH
jgi:hypothetical protein